MILVGNILISVSTILGSILTLANLLIIAYVILSWVNADRYNPIARFINSAVEPMMLFIKKYIKTTVGNLDLAPIVVIFAITILQTVVVKSLSDYGHAFVMGAY